VRVRSRAESLSFDRLLLAHFREASGGRRHGLADVYGLRHLLAHLIGAGEVDTAEALLADFWRNVVGMPGFEPGTSCTPSRRATRLRYIPKRWAALDERVTR
jgi:hypothetical protein